MYWRRLPKEIPSAIHEDYARPDAHARPSERNFGVTFSVVFALVAAYSFWHASMWGVAWLAGAAAFLLAALLRPAILAPLNERWSDLSLALHKVLNPVVMLVLYIVSIVPVGVVMKLAKRDPMSRAFDRGASTYWIDRRGAADEQRSLRNQF